MLLNANLNFTTLSANQGVISGVFTRDYINDIILPGETFITNSDMPSIDLKNASVCDSAAVALLVHWWGMALKQNKKIVFTNLSDKMLSIMRISSIDNIIIN
jgi:ABC-type transporter Mla MlaB component